jgi:pimeloyl-ACP methyl ester carboxylesterase
MFNPQVEVLLSHYRVLLPDVRGHGRSQRMGEAFTLELAAAVIATRGTSLVGTTGRINPGEIGRNRWPRLVDGEE